MTQHQATYEGGAVTVYCPHCGQPMRVAAQHMQGSVECPHCSTHMEPGRVLSAPHDAATMPYPARPPQGSAPYYAPRVNEYGEELSRCNRWVAGALAILLGCFGVHRFYLGYKGWGFTQLLITLGTFFALSWVVAIWAFIEGILCFVGTMRDVEGRRLSG